VIICHKCHKPTEESVPRGQCKECKREYDRIYRLRPDRIEKRKNKVLSIEQQLSQKLWYIENEEDIKLKARLNQRIHRLKSLGYSIQDYDKLFQSQNGCCAICGINRIELNRDLCADHNHASGKLRGLLRAKCNSVLGFARDDKEILIKAIAYLELFEK
jgi:hypothetical protein